MIEEELRNDAGNGLAPKIGRLGGDGKFLMLDVNRQLFFFELFRLPNERGEVLID